MTLRPLAISCAKDYKEHSFVQASFTEPPNRLDLLYQSLMLSVTDYRLDLLYQSLMLNVTDYRLGLLYQSLMLSVTDYRLHLP